MRKIKFLSVIFTMLVFLAGCNKSAAADFKGKKVTVSVENAAETILGLTEDTRLVLTGRFKAGDMDEIASALEKLKENYSNNEDDSVETPTVNIFLDMSKTEGLKKIKEDCFKDLDNLVGIMLPKSVTEIDGAAFWHCTFLKYIEIPNSVTRIGDRAFYYCESLESIVIPDSVTKIEDSVFYCCTSLKSVVLPTSVTEFGHDFSNVFYGCENLSSITIPGNAWKFEDEYSSSDVLVYVKDNVVYAQCDEKELLDFYPAGKKDKKFKIPDTVTVIGDSAFAGCSFLETVIIPNSVTEIYGRAFSYCMSLESIVIPDSVTEIGNSVFWHCESLKTVVIPDSVSKIRDNAFWSCSSLESIVIPDSVTEIGDYAFDSCESLKTVVIPDSVTKIGKGVFEHCESLESVKLSESLDSIPDVAFHSCESLISVELPKTVWEIGDNAFGNCHKLRAVGHNINLDPDIGVITCFRIGEAAFYGCESLKNIAVWPGINDLGENAFYGCASLQTFSSPFNYNEKMNDGTLVGDYIFGKGYWPDRVRTGTSDSSEFSGDWEYTDVPYEHRYNK